MGKPIVYLYTHKGTPGITLIYLSETRYNRFDGAGNINTRLDGKARKIENLKARREKGKMEAPHIDGVGLAVEMVNCRID